MRISDRIRILIPVLAVSLAVSACSIFEDDKPAYVEKPVDELYNRGVDQMGSRKFADAALTFEEVERQHPYS
ncbi:MAG TPA: outer membrane protein assembly factor BamD, partial [Rhodospirillaceae bacterium]|nr:outer membrane protein assembly factor BamD [Rhodospirillaceae bacterium]